ncbi:hypothetical protein AVEN_117962-1 [Araneus ventricosus]|uniref:Uncharacterized protein n=1 Tax=Araneus ventricosus TaxID=182803 RepID=A0A4Y2H6A7_ARAVE|nr:hypothetical protein AVEN_117962-1 [Araneus ventricosus]
MFSLVIFKSHFKATRDYFWDGSRILDLCQMTRTTLELTPISKLPRYTSERAFDPLRMIKRATGPIHDGSSVETGFEPSDPKAETLPLGHSGSLFMYNRPCCK